MAYSNAEIAEVIHEVIRLLQRINGEQVVSGWDAYSPEERQAETRYIAELRAGEVSTGEQHHEAWARMRSQQGWTYGPVKDYERKTTPLLVPYAELPWRQRVKDKVCEALVPLLAEEEG